ncbi:MAG TPA: signal peptidase II [Agromyces sp.]|jgi:signal peptidase II
MSEPPTEDGSSAAGQNEPADSSATRRRQRWSSAAPWIAVGIAIAVIAADQLSKLWAEQTLTEGERSPLLGDLLGLQLAYNAGAAFSLGTGVTWIFTILAGVGTVIAVWFAWRVRSRAWAICIGLLLGGATTHFLDRLLRAPAFGQGHVVDFIAYYNWFIGNIADIAIFAGAIMLLVLTALGLSLRPAAGAAGAAESEAESLAESEMTDPGASDPDERPRT